MALQKNTTFKGINLTYHKIESYSVYPDTAKTVIQMHSYLSKEDRDAEIKNAFTNDIIELNGVFETREDCYIELKKLPLFEGAINA